MATQTLPPTAQEKHLESSAAATALYDHSTHHTTDMLGRRSSHDVADDSYTGKHRHSTSTSPMSKPAHRGAAGAAAASLAHGRSMKPKEGQKPSNLSAAGAAASLAHSQSQSQSKAREPDSWNPTTGEKISSHKGKLHNERATPRSVYVMPDSTKQKALNGALGAMKVAPGTQQRASSAASDGSNAYKAATTAHKPSRSRSDSGSRTRRAFEPVLNSDFNSVGNLTHQERRKSDILRAATVSMARRDLGKERPVSMTVDSLPSTRRSSRVPVPEYPAKTTIAYPNLEAAARKVAHARLASIGYIPSSTAAVDAPIRRPRSASTGSANVVPDRGVRFEGSRALEQERIDAAEQQRRKGAEAVLLLTTARRNVEARMSVMEKDIAARRGLQKREDWQVVAENLAKRQNDSRFRTRGDREGKIDLGLGAMVDPEEVEQLARRNVQPIFDDINDAAAEKRRVAEGEEARRLEAKLEVEKERRFSEFMRRQQKQTAEDVEDANAEDYEHEHEHHRHHITFRKSTSDERPDSRDSELTTNTSATNKRRSLIDIFRSRRKSRHSMTAATPDREDKEASLLGSLRRRFSGAERHKDHRTLSAPNTPADETAVESPEPSPMAERFPLERGWSKDSVRRDSRGERKILAALGIGHSHSRKGKSIDTGYATQPGSPLQESHPAHEFPDFKHELRHPIDSDHDESRPVSHDHHEGSNPVFHNRVAAQQPEVAEHPHEILPHAAINGAFDDIEPVDSSLLHTLPVHRGELPPTPGIAEDAEASSLCAVAVASSPTLSQQPEKPRRTSSIPILDREDYDGDCEGAGQYHSSTLGKGKRPSFLVLPNAGESTMAIKDGVGGVGAVGMRVEQVEEEPATESGYNGLVLNRSTFGGTAGQKVVRVRSNETGRSKGSFESRFREEF